MRGQQLLNLDIPVVAKGNTQRKRNFYHPQRNQDLVVRYYYHSEIHRLRYDVCISLLEKEFYLTSHRIITLLTKEIESLKRLAATQPNVNDLQKLAPHFVFKLRQL